jgi:hypothetical protein
MNEPAQSRTLTDQLRRPGKCCSLQVVKGALVTFLVVTATATQPLLAAPAACNMDAGRTHVSCAPCCAAKSCCRVTEQKDAAPLATEATFWTGPLAAFPTPSIAIDALPDPFRDARAVLRINRVAHSPPPLAVSCIFLI